MVRVRRINQTKNKYETIDDVSECVGDGGSVGSGGGFRGQASLCASWRASEAGGDDEEVRHEWGPNVEPRRV